MHRFSTLGCLVAPGGFPRNGHPCPLWRAEVSQDSRPQRVSFAPGVLRGIFIINDDPARSCVNSLWWGSVEKESKIFRKRLPALRSIRSHGRCSPLKKCATGFARVEIDATRRHWESQWHPKFHTKPFFSTNRSWRMLWFNVPNIQHVVVLRYFQEGFSPVSCCTVTKTPCFGRFQAGNGYFSTGWMSPGPENRRTQSGGSPGLVAYESRLS